MRRIGLLLILLLIFTPLLMMSWKDSEVGATQCTYGSTQARVQQNINIAWQKEIVVGCEKSFNVGSFHNGTGQFATDTAVTVEGPGLVRTHSSNGATMTVSQSGSYTVRVVTNGQTGAGCEDTATVHVVCQEPPVQPATCSYQSTQARVQKDITQPWVSRQTLSCGETFRVGSFHNGTDQFATDTRIQVTAPFGLDHQFVNGDTLRALFPGLYFVNVTTPGCEGQAFTDFATVHAMCSRWWEVR